MKFVATPRPEKNDWKSIVGPWIVALRPPAHSTCATLRPPRSADWAIDSAWSTPGSNAAVRFANGWPLRWNVLLVEPWTPGHAPVARLYQPAPGVRRRLGEKAVPAGGRALLQEVRHGRHAGPARRTSRRCPDACRRRRRTPPSARVAGLRLGRRLHAGGVGGACREGRERRDGDDRDECHASHPVVLPFVSIGISDGVREPGAGRAEPSSTSDAVRAASGCGHASRGFIEILESPSPLVTDGAGFRRSRESSQSLRGMEATARPFRSRQP